MLWKRLDYMAGPWGIETCGHIGKRLLGRGCQGAKASFGVLPTPLLPLPSLYFMCISENSFPVAMLLTNKWPSVSACCRHSAYTYFLVELEYRNTIRNVNSGFTLLTSWLIFSKSLDPCFFNRTPRCLDYMSSKIPPVSGDSLSVWFWVDLVIECPQFFEASWLVDSLIFQISLSACMVLPSGFG